MKRARKSIPAIALAAVLLIAVIGGTFAYFSQTSTAENYISVKDYDSTLEETFSPPDDGFAPEIEVTKEVGVANTGEIPMLVRMTYTEYWDAVENVGLLLADPVAGMYNGDTDNSSLVRKWAGTGLTGWLYGGDGYYYYMAVLNPGDTTDLFITAIELKDLAVTIDTYYDVTYWDGTQFVTETGLNEADKDDLLDDIALIPGGYVSSIISNQTSTTPGGTDYMLKLTTQTIQAVSEAAATWAPTTPAVTAFLATI